MRAALAAVLVAAALVSLTAQDRLPAMPGYRQYQEMAPRLAGAWTSGAIAPHWAGDGQSFTYALTGHSYRFDLAAMRSIAVLPPSPPKSAITSTGSGIVRPALATLPPQNGVQPEIADAVSGCPPADLARGRQADCSMSRDGRLKAFYRARNLWLSDANGSNERPVTTDGSETTRIKYGTASWVYGEELGQTTAIWWSPDSSKVAFYRFDESRVKDFFVAMDQTDVQDSVDVEAYPKAGTPNPIADVLVYDVSSGRTTRIDVRDGKPFDDEVLGHYVWDVQWRPDGRELILDRANRRQQILELDACRVDTGNCRAVVHEEWRTGWVNTDSDPLVSPSPTPRWLPDGRRFIWESERTGWKNYYLYDLDAGLIRPLTANAFEAANLIKIDVAAGVMFYTARDGDNYLELQLHRVPLGGGPDVRLTDPAFTHTIASCLGVDRDAPCGISPDNRHVVDVYQRHDTAPATQLLDEAGHVLAQVAQSDLTRADAMGLKRTEQFSYRAADGATLYGEIRFPSNFDPSKTYPVLVPVYGGPVLTSNVPTEIFSIGYPTCEYGFLVVTVGYRGVPGTGKHGADALYMKLGRTEIDDIAEGVRALRSRPYIDRTRVGIYGTSYGGYVAAMEIVRHPDVFSAAVASSPPTDWRNYDTIYTERYMWTPAGNASGYEAGSVATYAKDLQGRLLIYYGTADNNVHPSNALQLIKALQDANKSFDVQVGPDEPHSSLNVQRMMEFFIEHLVIHPEQIVAP